MAEKNDAPLGVNETLRFEPGEHLEKRTAHPSINVRRPFGYGEGVYEEDTGKSWPAKYEDRRARETALKLTLKTFDFSKAFSDIDEDLATDFILTRAEAFHRFLTGKAAD